MPLNFHFKLVIVTQLGHIKSKIIIINYVFTFFILNIPLLFIFYESKLFEIV